MFDAIVDYIEVCKKCGLEIPDVLKEDYEIEFIELY
jgi:hypothetical protein